MTTVHSFKIRQYYLRKIRPLVYRIEKCNGSGDGWRIDNNYGPCETCKIKLGLRPISGGALYCCLEAQDSKCLKKITKLEAQIREL